MPNISPIVVFSHLRWDFVYQRPQHIFSRLAGGRRVFFVEEPVSEAGCAPGWQFSSPHENVLVCRPQSPIAAPGFAGEQMDILRSLLEQLVETYGLQQAIAWLYTPMAVPLLDILSPRRIVFDCMDDLSAFKFAPPELLELERQLLERADVVFTGGPSLYRAKQGLHANVHCFPSSIDGQHFAQAAAGLPEHPALAGIPYPRLGYVGVIDERIDLDAIDHAAAQHPDWQIVMVGPTAKIADEALPRRSNIHYLGQRSYGDLPSFLTGFDVCLMPFALNDATRSISPTKVLEYMASEKLIVSTPIRDVAEPYGHCVRIAEGSAAFVNACEQAIDSTQADRQRRLDSMRQIVANTSWDDTVERMERLLEGTPDSAPKREDYSTVVVGAGPTGLSAAYHLGPDALLIEQESQIGGWCRSMEVNGFVFDFAGHIMFSNDPYVHEMYSKLLGDNVHWQDREAWIYSHDVHTRYPFQGALYGLPSDVIKECLLGAIEARFGSGPAIASPVAASANASTQSGNGKDAGTNGAAGHNGHSLNGSRAADPDHASQSRSRLNGHSTDGANGLSAANGQSTNGGTANGGTTNGRLASCKTQLGSVLSLDIKDCCADGVMESTAPLHAPQANGHAPSLPENFEDFIYRVWGRGIAKHFAIPYNRKLWAVPLSEMETSWLGGRVPMPNIEEMIDGALQPVPKPMGPNARFGYPLRGGFQALMNGFMPHVQQQLRLNTRVVAVAPSEHRISLSDGTTVEYDDLISTMPLPVLIRLMGDEVPESIRAAAGRLRFVSVRCVHIGVGRENLTEKHWIYYPGNTVFHRIFVQGNASPHCNPPGGFGLTCEITYSPHKPLPCDGDDLIARCIDECRQVGLIGAEDPIWAALQCDLPHAYVVYDHARRENVDRIRAWLAEHDILLAGRYSEWEYYNSDHAFLAGMKAAEQVRSKSALRGSRRFEGSAAMPPTLASGGKDSR